MPRLMPAHVGVTGGRIPPLELLEPLIEKAEPHWYWGGDFRDDGDLRWAMLRWETAVYVVARVLWQHANNVSLFRQRLRNTCGLSTCVRPDHFERVVSSSNPRFGLPDPCVLPGGEKAHVVRVDFTTTHVLLEGAERYICGRKRSPSTNFLPNETEISCKRCVATWRQLGRPSVPCA